MPFARLQFYVILLGLEILMRLLALIFPAFRERLKEKNLTAQIKLQDNSLGRYYTFRNGKVRSKSGIHPKPDITIFYHSAELAARLMRPNRSQLEQINAMKNFQIGMEGPDELTSWFMETLSLMLSAGLKFGTDMGNGVRRYTSNTNGGPVFVYVKDGKILRITPIDFAREDAPSWTIEARGRTFTPPRKTTLSPYSFAWKSMVYSQDRLLYPMKRVDFDPKGARNCANRGISGYERISWDEALDMVADEIKRVKRDHGPGAILNGSGSHHTWGNLGYWLSARLRFFNSIGFTPVVHNPDSWEGWYWG
ncbi:MAG: molybdopterin-dependent oxidoreductase, partial [Deltaproteobacteria bacterium]|nr:molybdopterin-dependent oxidoreductase [Deltaproteobacteria bacterium]